MIFERSRSPACLLLSLAGHVSGPAHLRFLTAWSRLSDSRETQMDPRWEGPAKQTSSPPCQNTQLRGTHPRLPACSLPAPRCCQAARQLMSPGTHLPAPRRPPDINLLNTRNLFMAGRNSETAAGAKEAPPPQTTRPKPALPCAAPGAQQPLSQPWVLKQLRHELLGKPAD